MKTLKNLLFPLALVAVTAASAQTVSVNPSSLSLSGLVGGPKVSQPLNILTTSGSPTYAAFSSQSWLSASPSSGTAPGQITVTADPTGLNPGTYTDNNFRIVTATQIITVPVNFTVGAITVTPGNLTFSYTAGTPTVPQGQILTVNGLNLNYTVSAATASGGNWLAAVSNGTNQISVVLNGIVLSGLATGTYQGTVTVTQTGSAAISVPVTLTVSPQPPVTVSPTTVNLAFQIGGQNNLGLQQPVTLSTTSTTPLPYQFGQPSVNPNPAGANWITVNPTSGTIPAAGSAQSMISYNTSVSLPAGNYSGTVPVAATGGQVSTGLVNVNLLITNSPLLILPTQALNFTYEIGGAQPASQMVTPQSTAVAASSSTGQMPITVSATTASGGNWLNVSPTANLNTGTPFTVSVSAGNLLPGTYTGTITVTPASGVTATNPAQSIAVTLTVANDPSIQASVNAINVPYQIGQANPQAQAQTINLTSSTGAALNYTIASSETTCGSVNWLAVSPASGTTNGSFTFTPSNLASLTEGTCTGTITVTATNPATGNAAINSPLTIPVNLYVSANPMLVTSTPALTFTTPVGGGGTAQQIIVSSTNPSSTLTYSVSETTNNGNSSWLQVGPLSGSTANGSNVIGVSVSPALLSAGTYTGSITITSTGVPNSPVTIPVTLQVTSGALSVSKTALSFTATAGASTAATQTVQVTGTGGTLNFTAAANSGTAGVNWLSATPTSGSTPATLTISANPGSLAVGTYTGAVTVTSPNAQGSPAVITVTLTVTSGTLTATPAPTDAGLTFTQPAGGTAPASQTISLAGTPGAINFTATGLTATGGNWLAVTPSTGTTPATVTISVSAGTLPVGPYTGTVTINAPGANPSQLVYPVTLNVVTPLVITATPSTLNFGYTLNSTAPAAQTVQLNVTAPPGVGAVAQFPFTTSVTTSNNGNWLSVTPTTGTVPGSISVAVNPQGLGVGNYTGTITVASGNSNGASAATISVRLAVTTAPTPVIAAVTNGASYSAGAVSPGELVSIFGTNFGPSGVVQGTVANNAFPTTVANTQVLFDGIPAPITAVTNGQVNAIVPYGIAGRATTTIQVSYLGVSSAGIPYNVTNTVPGIFTANQMGTGQGSILNDNLSGNSASNPAAKGSVIAIYMTGEGVTSPASATGQIAPGDGTGLNKPVANVTATIGGVSAPVQYYGSAPGLVYGVMQVNVLVPSTVASGNQQVVVMVGNSNSQGGVTVAIK